MGREVFISYSQPDHDCAMELVERVEREGINCWIAPRDIAPSADWAAEIIDAIANCARHGFGFLGEQQRFAAGAPRSRARGAQASEHPAVSHPERAAVEEPRIFLELAALAGCLSAAARCALRWLCSSQGPFGRTELRCRAAPDIASTQPAPVLATPPQLDPAELVRIERLLAGTSGRSPGIW